MWSLPESGHSGWFKMNVRCSISVPCLNCGSWSSAQDVLPGWPGTCPFALCVTLSWTAESISVLPVMWWAIVGPHSMSSVRRVWRMRQKGIFPVQVVWASPLYFSLVGWFGLRVFAGKDLAYVKSLTQINFVRKRSLQKHCLASNSDNAPAEISDSLFSVFVVAANTDLLLSPVKISMFDWLLWHYFHLQTKG